jgi:hypothetical protein
MEPEDSLLCSQEPAAGLCPEPDESSPYPPPHPISQTSILIILRKRNVGQDISVCITNGLQARRLRNWGRSLAGARDLSLLHTVQTGSGAHQASYTMGTGGDKLTIHLHLVPILRMGELYLHYSIRLQGVVLK